MIEWNEAYATGVEKLDKQHKNIFQYCNDLEEGLENKVISKQTLDGALKFLGSYIKEHFSQEETCMHQFACPLAGKNKTAHQEFIKEYNMFRNIITEDCDNESVVRSLHHYLENWIKGHICTVDVGLRSCVHKSSE